MLLSGLHGFSIGSVGKDIKNEMQLRGEYAKDVMMSTNEMLQKLDYQQMKRCFGDEDSKMPFSRHWIMHIEAMQRIKNKLCKLARKGVDPIAYCGFSCNHCFLSEWCGSCRTAYHVCSFATCMPDKKCPNAVCCQDKNIDGCYECEEIETCTKGFYTPENDGANAAKAQAMFIKKYGKRHFCLFMISCMRNMILQKRRRYSDRICGRDWRCWRKHIRGKVIRRIFDIVHSWNYRSRVLSYYGCENETVQISR